MKNHQRGVALITAVMIVAFASTVGAALMVQQNLVVHRSANLVQQEQAWWYSVGLGHWGATLLDRDREDNATDHLGEAWAQAVDFLPVDEGVLAGQMVDLQGRFNLRSLLRGGQPDEARKAQFVRLLDALDAVKPGQAEEIATAVIDWMDGNTEPGFPGGAEDGVYLSKEQPYRTPNLLMVSVSELLLVQGVSAQIYAELEPLVAVHPGDHRINVNTAPPAVLLSLSDKLTAAQVEALIKRRDEAPFESNEAIVADAIFSGSGVTSDDVAAQSTYFRADTIASIGNVRLSFVTLLERPENGKTRILVQSRNIL